MTINWTKLATEIGEEDLFSYATDANGTELGYVKCYQYCRPRDREFDAVFYGADKTHECIAFSVSDARTYFEGQVAS